MSRLDLEIICAQLDSAAAIIKAQLRFAGDQASLKIAYQRALQVIAIAVEPIPQPQPVVPPPPPPPPPP